MSSECDDICDSEPSDMSHMADENQVFTAEYKDGQLQIVEVTPFDKREHADGSSYRQEPYHEQYEEQILSPAEESDEGTKYLQILDPGKGTVHLDLLNFTLVKCDDGNTYKMVTGDNTVGEGGDTTITCVLSDVDDNQESSYVMVTEDDTDPYIYLQTTETQLIEQPLPEAAPSESHNIENSKVQLTPFQILERTKKLKKARALLRSVTKKSNRGRQSKTEFPPPQEILSSPNFKLYLYNCKMCSFKCNAIKEMSAHKASEHGGGQARGARGGAPGTGLQCARCPYRGHTHSQLMRHVRDTHAKDAVITKAVKLDSVEVEAADVLVCGACGFESGDRALFKAHIEDVHGATTTV